jgi:hypothetical protein
MNTCFVQINDYIQRRKGKEETVRKKEPNGYAPSHVESRMTFRTICLNKVPMRADANNEKPQTEPPKPQTRHIRQELKKKGSARFARIPTRHYLG